MDDAQPATVATDEQVDDRQSLESPVDGASRMPGEEEAVDRALYRSSPEGRRATKYRYVMYLGPLGVAMTYGGAVWWAISASDDEVSPWAIVLTVVGVVLLVAVGISALLVLDARRRYEDNKLLKERGLILERAADELLRAIDDDPSELIAYWRATHDRLDSYHGEARSQLASAYRLTQMAALLGFLVVVVLGTVAAFSSSSANAVVVGGVAAVGAALSGYIGHTFQATYERALEQRMAFFSQPVNALRLLDAERLLKRIERPEARDEAVLTIVRAAVGLEREAAIGAG